MKKLISIILMICLISQVVFAGVASKSIITLAPFTFNGESPLDTKQVFETYDDMVDFPDRYLSDGSFTYCIETKKYYTYNKDEKLWEEYSSFEDFTEDFTDNTFNDGKYNFDNASFGFSNGTLRTDIDVSLIATYNNLVSTRHKLFELPETDDYTYPSQLELAIYKPTGNIKSDETKAVYYTSGGAEYIDPEDVKDKIFELKTWWKIAGDTRKKVVNGSLITYVPVDIAATYSNITISYGETKTIYVPDKSNGINGTIYFGDTYYSSTGTATSDCEYNNQNYVAVKPVVLHFDDDAVDYIRKSLYADKNTKVDSDGYYGEYKIEPEDNLLWYRAKDITGDDIPATMGINGTANFERINKTISERQFVVADVEDNEVYINGDIPVARISFVR